MHGEPEGVIYVDHCGGAVGSFRAAARAAAIDFGVPPYSPCLPRGGVWVLLVVFPDTSPAYCQHEGGYSLEEFHHARCAEQATEVEAHAVEPYEALLAPLCSLHRQHAICVTQVQCPCCDPLERYLRGFDSHFFAYAAEDGHCFGQGAGVR